MQIAIFSIASRLLISVVTHCIRSKFSQHFVFLDKIIETKKLCCLAVRGLEEIVVSMVYFRELISVAQSVIENLQGVKG